MDCIASFANARANTESSFYPAFTLSGINDRRIRGDARIPFHFHQSTAAFVVAHKFRIEIRSTFQFVPRQQPVFSGTDSGNSKGTAGFDHRSFSAGAVQRAEWPDRNENDGRAVPIQPVASIGQMSADFPTFRVIRIIRGWFLLPFRPSSSFIWEESARKWLPQVCSPT